MILQAQVKRWRGDPAAIFLAAVLIIFLIICGWRAIDAHRASRTISVDAAQVARLRKDFESDLRRAPTPGEMDRLIRGYIREEIYYREAVRLNLDNNDPVIRRHLRSKMENVIRARLNRARPDDATLQKMLDKNPGKYAANTRYSFDQIFLTAFDPEIAGAKAQAALARLNNIDNWQALSDPLPVPPRIDDMPRGDIAKIFGQQFADELTRIADAPKNRWLGPIGSGFGIHLLRIRKVTASAKPRLADVRQILADDWRTSSQEAREAQAYQKLRDRYRVIIDKP